MRFITRHIQNTRPINVGNQKQVENNPKGTEEKVATMNTEEKIMAVSEILNGSEEKRPVKKIKKEKGLIERTETSKIILNEDNKQLLSD